MRLFLDRVLREIHLKFFSGMSNEDRDEIVSESENDLVASLPHERNDASLMSNLISAMDMADAAPSLHEIQSLQNAGKIAQSDNVTFCSKFVDPSSSDSDDNAAAPYIDIPSASEKELENAILHFAKVGNSEVCCKDSRIG